MIEKNNKSSGDSAFELIDYASWVGLSLAFATGLIGLFLFIWWLVWLVLR